MIKMKLSTAPTTEPITTKDCKEHMRVELGDMEEDAYIWSLILTVRKYTEEYTGLALIDQTWKMWLDDWPDQDYIEIPKPPLIWTVVDSYIKYKNTAGTESTWAATNYIVENDTDRQGRIVLAYGKTYPGIQLYPSNPIEIKFDCGYSSAANVPEPIKHAMKMLVAELFENREITVWGMAVTGKLEWFHRLLDNYVYPCHGDPNTLI